MDFNKNSWYETLRDQALSNNDNKVALWSKYKNDLEDTKFLLSLIPNKMKHDTMVSIGSKALMRGKIVHTNEFLVNLGETWFVKRTGAQVIDICNRRIETCDEMIKKLLKERELITSKSSLPAEQEAFGSEERPEIIEFLTEEENEEWMKNHRIREKKYRQQLAEIKKKEISSPTKEENLWKHLDELELQEELEDELNRLNAEYSNNEDDTESLSSNINEECDKEITCESDTILKENKQNLNLCEKPPNEIKSRGKVSFECDLDSSDDEPLKLEITHSSVNPILSDSKLEINSPYDIYKQYLNLCDRAPISILKNKVDPNEKKESQEFENIWTAEFSEDEETQEINEPVSIGVRFNDIIERNSSNELNIRRDEKSKKISKFKALRSNTDLKF